jgi:DNA-binding CsgD family transcriptional regulator
VPADGFPEKGAAGVSQWGVQLVIGRLVTDGVFRRRVERGGSAYLAGFRSRGVELNRTEIAALIKVDPSVWASVARQIDLGSKSRATRENDAPRIETTLSRQQQRVLAGICEGLRNKDIAAQLGISEGAVKATVQQLFRRFSVRRRVQLVRLALNARSSHPDRSRPVREAPSDVQAHGDSGGAAARAS